MKSYCQTKLANVLFARELASRLQGTGVNVYSLHPGVIRTQIIRYLPMWRKIIAMIVLMFLKSPREGAQTTIYCSVDESLGNKSGLYYSDCAPKTPAPQALDNAAAKRLWDLSASMVGLAQTTTAC